MKNTSDFKITKTNDEGVVWFVNNGKSAKKRLEMFDISTQSIIYIDEQIWQSGIDYYMAPGRAVQNLKRSGKILLKIIDPKKGIELEHLYEFDGNRRKAIVNGKNIIFKSPPDDSTYHLINEIFWELTYQKDYVKIDTGDIVVDIGANIGVFSAYAQQFKPTHTYSLEPANETFNYLKQNMKGFNNVTIIEKGISKTGGPLEMTLSNTSACHVLKTNTQILNSNIQSHLSSRPSSTTVQTQTINQFIEENNIDIIDFLKVDCEGGEYDLFTTLDKDYLTNNIRKIVLEYHSPLIKTELLNIFKKYGFLIECINEIEGDLLGHIYAYNPKLIKTLIK
jgi:FkbM family methyltransferase